MVRINTRIHAVFVSKATGELLKEHAHWEEGERCIFPFQNDSLYSGGYIFYLFNCHIDSHFCTKTLALPARKKPTSERCGYQVGGSSTLLLIQFRLFGWMPASGEKCVPFVLRITRIRKFLSSSLSTWISFELCSWLTKWEPNLWILRSKRRTWLYNSWM